jgi:hypothetical protein
MTTEIRAKDGLARRRRAGYSTELGQTQDRRIERLSQQAKLIPAR